jgi:hypothetical protein
MLTYKPLPFSQNVFWLDATITDINVKASIYSTIYKADYDLLHRHFGHPSKDVLSRARTKTKGFSKDLRIPTEMPVFPGYGRERSLHLPIHPLKPELKLPLSAYTQTLRVFLWPHTTNISNL